MAKNVNAFARPARKLLCTLPGTTPPLHSSRDSAMRILRERVNAVIPNARCVHGAFWCPCCVSRQAQKVVLARTHSTGSIFRPRRAYEVRLVSFDFYSNFQYLEGCHFLEDSLFPSLRRKFIFEFFALREKGPFSRSRVHGLARRTENTRGT
jgi:hypothetical protein